MMNYQSLDALANDMSKGMELGLSDTIHASTRCFLEIYEDLKKNNQFSDFLGLRDYYSFARQLAVMKKKGLLENPQRLIYSVYRNFGKYIARRTTQIWKIICITSSLMNRILIALYLN